MLFGVDFRVGVKKDDNELRDNYKVCGDNMLKEQKDWILEIVKKIMIKEILIIVICYHIKNF